MTTSAIKETHKITVTVDGRKFICHMKDAAFLRIYERMTSNPTPHIVNTFNRIVWHYDHSRTPKRGLMRRVMDAATEINKPL